MPNRKLNYPDSNAAAHRPGQADYTQFVDVFEDPPAHTLPEYALAKTINCHARGRVIACRYGSILQGNPFPALEDRTGYSAHKDGYYIVSDSGNIFSEDDVPHVWVWDNGKTDKILQYVNPQRVRVRDNDANTGVQCYLQGQLNLFEWHQGERRWVIQMADKLYIAEHDLLSYTEVYVFSAKKPARNAFSSWIEMDDFGIICNSNGRFKILLTNTPPLAYQIDSPVPNRRPSSTQVGELKHRYAYIFGCEYLNGSGNFRTREDSGVEILTETGCNTIDENRRDWAQIDTEEPIGTGEDTYGQLDGGAGIDTDPDTYTQNNGTFRININNLGTKNIIVDFTHEDNTVTMKWIAERIQDALRDEFPSATCQYVALHGTPRFRITSGRVAGGMVSYVTAGQGGIDISHVLRLRSIDNAVRSFPYVDQPHVLYDLWLPIVNATSPQQYQRHLNYYTIYRSADYLSGTHKNANGKLVANSLDQLILCKELRVAGAFYARRQNGIIELQYGEFEPADVYSVVEFDDGSRTQIIEYIDSTHARYSTTPYYNDSTPWMAAAIGNGRVIRFSQSGDLITRHAGDTFTSADELKPLWYHTGERTVITQYVDANHVRVADDTTRSLSGITLDPTHRNFYDTLSDDKLLPRASGWTALGRFMREFEPGNVLGQQPGYITTCRRGGKKIQYCQTEERYKSFIGYHIREYQKVELEKVIEAIHDFPDRFSALCKGGIYTGTVGNAQPFTIPGTQQTIFVLSTMQKLAGFGCAHYGSICRINDDWIRFVTDTEEVRNFNGWELSADLIFDAQTNMGRMQKALRKAYKQFTAIYSRVTGYLLWWRGK